LQRFTSLGSAALLAATCMLAGPLATAQTTEPGRTAAPSATASSPASGASQPMSKGEAKAIREFQMLDMNGDGKLSRKEVALIPRLAAAFDDADTNHDNYVTLDEVRAFAIKYRAERERAKAAAAAQAPKPAASEPASKP